MIQQQTRLMLSRGTHHSLFSGSEDEWQPRANLEQNKHLENSLKIFKALEEKVDRFDYEFQKKCVETRDFEGLEMYVMNLLMGVE